MVIATHDLDRALALLRTRFRIEEVPHSLNIAIPDSAVRVQIQRDPRYASFADRAQVRNVLGLDLPVADLGDVLYPDLRTHVPVEILERIPF